MNFDKFLHNRKGNAKLIVENENLTPLNEAEGGLLDFFKSMKAFSVLSTQWPTIYQEQKNAELEKVTGGAEMDAKIVEKTAEAGEQVDKQIKDALDKMPREKRAAAREKMEEKAKLQKEKIKAQLNAKKTQYDKQMDAKIADIKADLSELEKDNTIPSDLLSKKFATIKQEAILEIDSKFEEEKIEAIFSAKEGLLSDEKIEAMRQKSKEKMAEDAAEAKEKIASLEKEAKEKQEELDAKIASKEGDAKETLINMKDAQAGMQKYLTKGKEVTAMMEESTSVKTYINQLSEYSVDIDAPDVNEEEEGGDEELKKAKQELTEVRKEVQSKIDKLSVSKIKKALDVEEGDATEILNGLQEQWKETKDQYKNQRDEVKTDLDDEEGDPPNTEAEEAELTAAEEALRQAEEAGDKSDEELEELRGKVTAAQTKLDDKKNGNNDNNSAIPVVDKKGPAKGQNVSEDKPENKIMRFSDFMASK